MKILKGFLVVPLSLIASLALGSTAALKEPVPSVPRRLASKDLPLVFAPQTAQELLRCLPGLVDQPVQERPALSVAVEVQRAGWQSTAAPKCRRPLLQCPWW